MTYCTECCSVEQGTVEIEVDGEILEVCAACEMPEDTIKRVDEDYGRER